MCENIRVADLVVGSTTMTGFVDVVGFVTHA
jgi:hypothetical protein